MKVKKHIVIDARLYGPKHTGLGRYTKNLLIALKKLADFTTFRYTLLVYPELESEIKADLGNSFNYFVTNVRHYTFKEQLVLPIILHRLQPDLVHFTHLDKPIFYFKKSVVTVHDLIRHFSKGKDTTTRSPLLYWPKYWGYLLMTRLILLNSFVIVPSDFWRQYIIKHYHFPPEKIIVTHEAVDPIFIKKHSLKRDHHLLKQQNYILYTGNLYPHKNVEVIFEALKNLPKLQLKIICARSIFTDKIYAKIRQSGLDKQVDFLGYVPDSEFASLYQHALALVHPALLEGFSLTGLEAMALDCPVIAAKSSCLPEIYQDAALFFDPHNPADLVDKIKLLQTSPKLREKLIQTGRQHFKKYNWSSTAHQTLDFYKRIANAS